METTDPTLATFIERYSDLRAKAEVITRAVTAAIAELKPLEADAAAVMTQFEAIRAENHRMIETLVDCSPAVENLGAISKRLTAPITSAAPSPGTTTCSTPSATCTLCSTS